MSESCTNSPHVYGIDLEDLPPLPETPCPLPWKMEQTAANAGSNQPSFDSSIFELTNAIKQMQAHYRELVEKKTSIQQNEENRRFKNESLAINNLINRMGNNEQQQNTAGTTVGTI